MLRMADVTEAAQRSHPKIRYVFSRNVFKQNSLIALVVGCLLTLTNQLDVMLAQPFTVRLATKIFFNFLIPFVVASVSAAMTHKCD
jgi:hypothetical protein